MPYPDLEYDMVISNSLVHHLPEPLSFFQEVKRLVKPGGAILIRDLIRPETTEQIDDLVSQLGRDYDSHQQDLFRDSLKAALTIAEVQTLLDRVNIPNVTVDRSSNLHWTIQRKFKGI
jgi:2-polyprenyl-3-methyl-5-hydroxy-6-metoxy-1,4-benzoquinol methylase